VAQLQAGQQAEADYRIPKGLSLRDEIGRYWRIAQAHWQEFAAGRQRVGDGARALALSERFVQGLLTDAFGFTSLRGTPPLHIDGRSYPIGLAASGGTVPVVVAPAGTGVDTASSFYGDGGRRRSPFGLVQEFLNASSGATWGLTSDGCVLRVVRDNSSLTRPAWIEADLARIFNEDRYADFAALWLLAHESRFGGASEDQEEARSEGCPLQAWRDASREQGTRAREALRSGFEDALLALGQGFLSEASNTELRIALRDGTLSKDAFFQQLLRLVYRFIFLLTVEERGLLHPPGADQQAKELYRGGYSLRRLRERSLRRSSFDRFPDLWEAMRIVFVSLAQGQDRLGLPALSGLFGTGHCSALESSALQNRFLLKAIFRLCWLREEAGLVRVNWRDMGPEELGSVYEGLLELEAVITDDFREFAFRKAGEVKGNARKTTGSYYTPDSLVQVLLDSTVEPLVAETLAENPQRPVEALLGLSIVDPACGSGHFLLAAARRLAGHVARQQSSGTPSSAEYRHAMRQVISRCIYGVDQNPMAVELCQVSLWMEAVEPGLPLNFLQSHIQCGNSLVGTSPELMAGGVPDAAWKAVKGDDGKAAGALRKRNKAAAAGQRGLSSLWSDLAVSGGEVGLRAAEELEASSDSDVVALSAKEQRWATILSSPEHQHAKFSADVWCAAFMWPKQAGEDFAMAPTNELWRQVRDGKGATPEHLLKLTRGLDEQFRFFHWNLQFPQVFAKGGFDIVLGNPPWDTLSPDRREFFSQFHPNIRSLSSAEQDKVIDDLMADQAVASAWQRYERTLLSLVHFLKHSGRYTLFAPGNLGKGDFNVYRMFTELALRQVRPGGFVALVLPGGIYGGANASALRQFILDQCELRQLWGLINTSRCWFPHVDIDRFAAYAAKRGGRTKTFQAHFGLTEPAELAEPPVEIDADFIRSNAPATYAIPDVREAADLTLAKKMLDAHPAFGERSEMTPRRHYQREIDMGNDTGLFTDDAAGLPVYEGRMITHFDHRAKTYESGHGNSSKWIERFFGDPLKAIVPQWRVLPARVPARLGDRCHRYRLAFCDVANPRNERSLTSALVPPEVICGDKVPTIDFGWGEDWRYLPWLAVANSFVMDWIARSKLSSPKMSFTLVDSLPFPRLALSQHWVQVAAPIVLRLVCASPEMVPFWNQMSEFGLCLPARDGEVPKEALLLEDEREQARAELDALVAHDVFGLEREELSAVLETFPVVRKRDLKKHGDYRTKRLILDCFDEIAKAAREKRPYWSRLCAPHADRHVES
jgi:hypothetical protein